MGWSMWMAMLAWASCGQVQDFDSHIIPVLTKAGCNSGACHGAAAGRGGFHLSLLGGDPASDYEAIVHQFEGRRIHRRIPERSLLLRKPMGELAHGGDVVLEEGSPSVERIAAWIRDGAQRGQPRRLSRLEVSPSRSSVSSLDRWIPLTATAHFDSGEIEEVTEWTVFTASDPAAVEIVPGKGARGQRPGQHVIIARYLDRVVPIQILIPYGDKIVAKAMVDEQNWIDQEISRMLAELGLPASPPVDDAGWLRRVTLDLAGRLPSLDELDAFERADSALKRDQVVDRLLHSDDFADFWTLKMARWLRIHRLPNEPNVVEVYRDWIRASITDEQGLDGMVNALLTATGDSHTEGAANFGRMVGDARGQAELVGSFFLGVRLGCANCHNHPLDKWTQDDYHGLAAIFSRLERGRLVKFGSRGAVTNLRTSLPAIPRLPGDRYLAEEGDHRAEVARWVLDPKHHYFARAMVNRLWREMMGRGLVEPADDLRDTNPATHPELLDRLAEDFAKNGYRMQRTLRAIALSQAYGRSSLPQGGNEIDDRFYSHRFARPLEPEVLVDAIADVTGVPNEFSGLDEGTRAIEVVDPLFPNPTLDLLGRCTLVAGCEDSMRESGGLRGELHLMNGKLINQKLTSPRSRITQLFEAGVAMEQRLSEIYRRATARQPTREQRAAWQEQWVRLEGEEQRQWVEDFVWSLLNSRLFRENY